MYADFRRSTQGTGASFKGALAYYLNDKGADGAERPTTDERVDVLELRNLATDDARHAWFEMMNTADASDSLKAAAGIQKGGRKGAKPVFTYYLAWADGEQPDRSEMIEAAVSTLKRLGLEDHQALIVSHDDTDNAHVHIIVNRVNPHDGRFASLSNSWKTLKEWAIDYSKERGKGWHIPLEQAKQARQQRGQTERQGAFNAGAHGQEPAPAQHPSSKPANRPEWHARKTAAPGDKAAEGRAAAAIRAAQDVKWQALRQAEQRAADQRFTELSQFREDRQALRSAIYAKFDEAYKAIWKPEPRQPASRPAPLPGKILKALSDKRRQFEQNERGIWGRLKNARHLAKGESLLSAARLALNGSERRRLFDLEQRKIASDGRWGKDLQRKVRADFPPEPKKFKAERLKQMRVDELAAFDRETQLGRRGLAAKHGEQIENLKAAKAALSAEGKAAWASHAATFRPAVMAKSKEQPSNEQEQPSRPQTESAEPSSTRPGAKQDRYGRSRDRKPRAPREDRQQRATGRRGNDRAATAEQGSRAERSEKHDGDTADRFNVKADSQQPAAQSDQAKGESSYVRTPAERQALSEIKARRAAEREANERGEDRGIGRER